MVQVRSSCPSGILFFSSNYSDEVEDDDSIVDDEEKDSDLCLIDLLTSSTLFLDSFELPESFTLPFYSANCSDSLNNMFVNVGTNLVKS